MFSNCSEAENLGLITSPILRPSLHHLCPLTARYSYVTHWRSWCHHVFHCTFIHRVTDLLLMPCAVSGCDMPTAHHRSFKHSLSVLFPFIPYLPKKEEEDYCVPLECFHVLQMRHKCFEVLLMESEGTHNTCQLASREDGFTYAQASVFEVLFYNLATRGCLLHL